MWTTVLIYGKVDQELASITRSAVTSELEKIRGPIKLDCGKQPVQDRLSDCGNH